VAWVDSNNLENICIVQMIKPLRLKKNTPVANPINLFLRFPIFPVKLACLLDIKKFIDNKMTQDNSKNGKILR